jgi:acetolactate synthase-1/3 small subunit
MVNRVVSFFRGRGFNVESFTVGHTELRGISRMTIVVDIERERTALVEANLYKLVDVAFVERVSDPAITQELALIRLPAGKQLASLLSGAIAGFHARIVAQSRDSVVFEVASTPREIDRVAESLRPNCLLEMVRTGPITMETERKSAIARGRLQDQSQ